MTGSKVELIRGVNRYSRTKVAKITGVKKAQKAAAPKKEKVVKKIGGSKNGQERVIDDSPKFYPAEDIKVPIRSRKSNRNPTKLRASITPGTVLILLAGRFKGKRVVFLKQLASGLLLVTGPFAVNGVPVRRVNQAYVIATSTKVDLTGVNAEKFDDAYFKKEKATKKKFTEEEFFAEDSAVGKLSEERKADQAALDKALLANIKKVESAEEYLQSRFSLSKNDFPHLLKF